MTKAAKRTDELDADISALQSKIEEISEEGAEIRKGYNQLISWAELYATSIIESKKMILYQLIDKIIISRGYKI